MPGRDEASAKQSATRAHSAPTESQASGARPPARRAIAAGSRKMPEPMMPLMPRPKQSRSVRSRRLPSAMGRDIIRLDVGRKLFALGLLFAGCAQPTDAARGPESDGGFVERSADGGGGGGEDLAHGGSTNCPVGLGDCDGNPANGCEAMLNTPDNCGACGKHCQQLGGSNACILVGASYVCKPSCDATH